MCSDKMETDFSLYIQLVACILLYVRGFESNSKSSALIPRTAVRKKAIHNMPTYCKVNTDGAWDKDSHRGGAGAVLRRPHGNFI